MEPDAALISAIQRQPFPPNDPRFTGEAPSTFPEESRSKAQRDFKIQTNLRR